MSEERKFEVMINSHVLYVIKAKDYIEAGAKAVQQYKQDGAIHALPEVTWICEVKK